MSLEITADQFVAMATAIAEKDDSECTPEELKMKNATAAITAAVNAKRDALTRDECLVDAKDQESKLNENTKAQAMTLEHPDVVKHNRLRAQRKNVDAEIKLFVKGSKSTDGSVDANKFMDLEKELKAIKASIGSINKSAREAGLAPIVATKRGGRKKKVVEDDGSARPMETGDHDEEEEESVSTSSAEANEF